MTRDLQRKFLDLERQVAILREKERRLREQRELNNQRSDVPYPGRGNGWRPVQANGNWRGERE